MITRRKFIKNTSVFGLLPFSGTLITNSVLDFKTGDDYQNDDKFWSSIKKEFEPSTDFLNLENGYYSPMPAIVKEAFHKNIDYVNGLTSFYMRNHWNEDKIRLKRLVADYLECVPKEFLFTRNTTESLNTVIMGLPLQSGDEILITDQDYPSALAQWKFRAKRDHLKLRVLNINNLSDDAIVDLFKENITVKSRILHTTHMIHSTGQVLPVRRLSDLAHKSGIEIIVDGAHSFNHVDFKIADLAADYFMCSLHKWTLNPLGSGLLYIKADKLESLSPLFGEIEFQSDDIRKMERLGTLNAPVFLTLPTSLDFHNKIGSARKESRLHYLKNYWAERIAKFSNVEIQTPLQKGKSGAIGNFTIHGKSNEQISKILFDKYRIFTSTTDDCPVKGVRVTVHLHTTTDELDYFISAIKAIATS